MAKPKKATKGDYVTHDGQPYLYNGERNGRHVLSSMDGRTLLVREEPKVTDAPLAERGAAERLQEMQGRIEELETVLAAKDAEIGELQKQLATKEEA